MGKKEEHNQYDFLPGTEGKIELSNNARGHPIACFIPPRLINKRFAIWGHPHFEMIIVCPRKPHHTYAHTHTHTHTHRVQEHFHSVRGWGGGGGAVHSCPNIILPRQPSLNLPTMGRGNLVF